MVPGSLGCSVVVSEITERFADGSFDRVLPVNVFQFWREPVAGLVDVRRHHAEPHADLPQQLRRDHRGRVELRDVGRVHQDDFLTLVAGLGEHDARSGREGVDDVDGDVVEFHHPACLLDGSK